MKQNQWIDQVNEAIKSVNDPQLNKLLKNIQGYTNIPRKQAKFLNFLSCSLRIRDNKLSIRAWQAIDEATQRLKEAQKPVKNEKSRKENDLTVNIEYKETKCKEEAIKVYNKNFWMPFTPPLLFENVFTGIGVFLPHFKNSLQKSYFYFEV